MAQHVSLCIFFASNLNLYMQEDKLEGRSTGK